MKKCCCFIIGLCLSPFLVNGDNGPDVMQIKAIVEAIRDAQRPSDSMHFEFEEEVTGVGVVYKGGSNIPIRPPFDRSSYTVHLKGMRSRIEQRYRSFPDPESKEADVEELHTYVFDGTRQKRLNVPIESKNILKGWQYLLNKNRDLIKKKVYRSPIDFSDPDILSKYTCELGHNEKDGVYTLEFIREGGIYYQYTVAPDKGYNILKMECYSHRGLSYEVNYSLKQHDNGVWYPSKISKFRYYNSKKLLENKIEFTKIEFNADIPDETFKLEFPVGAKIWDGILKDWFYVGGGPMAKPPLDSPNEDTEPMNSELIKGLIGDGNTTTNAEDANKTGISGSNDQNNVSEAKKQSTADKNGGALWLALIIGTLIFATIYFLSKNRKQ